MHAVNCWGMGSAAYGVLSRSDATYFGNVVAPTTSSLVHVLNGDIDTLDPAKSTGLYEFYVIPAVLEGLTQYRPDSPTPMAALATHYEANADCTEFRFYLRGHPAPKAPGFRHDDLPDTFVRRRADSEGLLPAYWSDGLPITAHDFVYAWRRLVDPQWPLLWGILSRSSRTPRRSLRGNSASKLGCTPRRFHLRG